MYQVAVPIGWLVAPASFQTMQTMEHTHARTHTTATTQQQSCASGNVLTAGLCEPNALSHTIGPVLVVVLYVLLTAMFLAAIVFGWFCRKKE